VREWLGAVTTGGIVEYDAASAVSTLPAERAVCLTGTSPRNLAPRSQSRLMLARRLPGVIAVPGTQNRLFVCRCAAAAA
jgi:hypothetical protein